MLESISNLKRPRRAILLFLGVLFFDQILKYRFRRAGEFFENSDSLFGMETNPYLTFIALCAFIFFARHELSKKKDRSILPLSLIFSGIISNTIDRISLGFVVDYIDFLDFCVFNIADMAIALGALFFVWRIVKE